MNCWFLTEICHEFSPSQSNIGTGKVAAQEREINYYGSLLQHRYKMNHFMVKPTPVKLPSLFLELTCCFFQTRNLLKLLSISVSKPRLFKECG